uniref:Uncharacterized protein n=1 Tax=Avena sativa TaxID=4498 RepID=A0ACD5TS40_AVESA
MKRSFLMYVITLLFIGCLVFVGHCRPEAPNATIADSSLDESKVTLKLCVARDCKTKGDPWINDCICCVTLPDVPCWYSTQECQANCPSCNPKCKFESALELNE